MEESKLFLSAGPTGRLRTWFDDRDDPIVEVPAPEEFSALDFMGGERMKD